MRPVLAALLLCSACFPPRDADCQTPGGMYIKGGDCSSAYPVQLEIEREAEAMGLGANVLNGQLIWVREDNFAGPSGEAAGLTYCESGMTILALPDGNWRHSALAHEAFHLAQHCAYDDTLFRECQQSGGEKCDFKAAHSHWDENVYPAINRITNAPMNAPANAMNAPTPDTL